MSGEPPTKRFAFEHQSSQQTGANGTPKRELKRSNPGPADPMDDIENQLSELEKSNTRIQQLEQEVWELEHEKEARQDAEAKLQESKAKNHDLLVEMKKLIQMKEKALEELKKKHNAEMATMRQAWAGTQEQLRRLGSAYTDLLGSANTRSAQKDAEMNKLIDDNETLQVQVAILKSDGAADFPKKEVIRRMDVMKKALVDAEEKLKKAEAEVTRLNGIYTEENWRRHVNQLLNDQKAKLKAQYQQQIQALLKSREMTSEVKASEEKAAEQKILTEQILQRIINDQKGELAGLRRLMEEKDRQIKLFNDVRNASDAARVGFDLVKARAENARLNREKQVMEQSHQQLIQSLQSEIVFLKASLSAKMDELARFTAISKVFDLARNELEQKVADPRAEVLNRENEAIRRSHQQQIQSLPSEMIGLKVTSSGSSNTRAANDQVTLLTQQFPVAHFDISGLENQKTQLAEDLAELDKLKNELKEHKEKIEKLESDLRKEQSECKDD